MDNETKARKMTKDEKWLLYVQNARIEERNKAIEECIEALSSYRDIDRTQMKEVLEALKGKQQ